METINVRVEYLDGRCCYSIFVDVPVEEARAGLLYAAARLRAQRAIGHKATIIGVWPPYEWR